jgi:hypothetical protein
MARQGIQNIVALDVSEMSGTESGGADEGR